MQKASLGPSSQDTNIDAFYAGLKKSGGRASKEHLCARCDSPDHWVVDCPVPAGQGNRQRKWNKRGNRQEDKKKEERKRIARWWLLGARSELSVEGTHW